MIKGNPNKKPFNLLKMHYPSDLGHSEMVSCYYRDLSASNHKTLLT